MVDAVGQSSATATSSSSLICASCPCCGCDVRPERAHRPGHGRNCAQVKLSPEAVDRPAERLPLFLFGVPIIELWRSGSGRSAMATLLDRARAGKDGRLIKVWKLRTMYSAAEEMLEQNLSRILARGWSGSVTANSAMICVSCPVVGHSCGGPAWTSGRKS